MSLDTVMPRIAEALERIADELEKNDKTEEVDKREENIVDSREEDMESIKCAYIEESDTVFSEFLSAIISNSNDPMHETICRLKVSDLVELLDWSGDSEYVAAEEIVKKP